MTVKLPIILHFVTISKNNWRRRLNILLRLLKKELENILS